jgi:Flp pilus assembly protein TadB
MTPEQLDALAFIGCLSSGAAVVVAFILDSRRKDAAARYAKEQQAALRRAAEAYKQAVQRRDTRKQHDAFPAYRDATAAQLRKELGR